MFRLDPPLLTLFDLLVYFVFIGGSVANSNAEPGGPGVAYMEGQVPVHKNLRVDNRCQSAKVTRPSGSRATSEDYNNYISTGEVRGLRLVHILTYFDCGNKIRGCSQLSTISQAYEPYFFNTPSLPPKVYKENVFFFSSHYSTYR